MSQIRRCLLASLPTLLAALPAAGAAPAPLPLQQARAPRASFADALRVDVVNVDVIVTDRRGEPIPGLVAGDFELFEDDKKKVKITNFLEVKGAELDSQQLAYVLFFDELHLRGPNRDRSISEMRAELEAVMAAGVPVMVVTHDGSLHVRQPMTGDFAQVAAALDAVAGRPTPQRSSETLARATSESVDQALRLLGGSVRDRRLGTFSMDGLAAQLRAYAESVRHDVALSVQALDALVTALAGVPGRKAVLYIGDGLAMRPTDRLMQTLQSRMGTGRRATGGDLMTSSGSGFGEGEQTAATGGDVNSEIMASASPDMTIARLQQTVDPFDQSAALRRLAGRANASRVSFFALKAPVGDAAAAEMRTPGSEEAAAISDLRESLEYLAQATAGAARTSANNAIGFVGEVGQTLTSYYSLGFTPQPRPPGTYVPLRLKAKARGVNVSYRDGYFSRSFQDRLADRTVGALVLDMTDNPHEVALEVESSTLRDDGSYDIVLLVFFPIGKLTLVEERGVHVADARVAVAVRTALGAVLPVEHLALPLQIPPADLESARTQLFGARVNLRLPAGEQRVALGLWDEAGGSGSFIAQALAVGGE